MQARQFLIPVAVVAALAAGQALAQETRPGASGASASLLFIPFSVQLSAPVVPAPCESAQIL